MSKHAAPETALQAGMAEARMHLVRMFRVMSLMLAVIVLAVIGSHMATGYLAYLLATLVACYVLYRSIVWVGDRIVRLTRHA